MADLDQDAYVATIDYGTDPRQLRCRCGACDWVGYASALHAIESCSLTPGDDSPAGRCPDCASLAYLAKLAPPAPFKTPVYLAAGKFLCAADAELIATLRDHNPDEAAAIVRLVNAGAEYDDEVEIPTSNPDAEAAWESLCSRNAWDAVTQMRHIASFLRERGLHDLLVRRYCDGAEPHAEQTFAPSHGVADGTGLAAAISVLEEAVDYKREQFDGDPTADLNVSGADLVDWFAEFRQRAQRVLALSRSTVATAQEV